MIDLDKLQNVAERAVKIQAGKEQLFSADEVVAVFEKLRQAEKDAARYRFIKQWSQSYSLNVYRKDLWDDVVDRAMWMESKCNK